MNFENYFEDAYVVGFCGPFRSGKSLAAGFVADIFGCTKVHFASGVKEIAKECFGWDGEKDEKGRRLLQRIGTDCGRMYNPNIWVEKTAKQIEYFYLREINRLFVIDDVRFDNEAIFVHLFKNSLVIKIDRELAKDELRQHASELGVNPALIDVIIVNDSSKNELGRKVIRCILEKFNV